MTSVWTSTRNRDASRAESQAPRSNSPISSKSLEGRAPRVPLSRCVREGHHPQQWKWDSWNSSLQLHRFASLIPCRADSTTPLQANSDKQKPGLDPRASHYGLRRQSAAATALSRAPRTRITSTRPARDAHLPLVPITDSPPRAPVQAMLGGIRRVVINSSAQPTEPAACSRPANHRMYGEAKNFPVRLSLPPHLHLAFCAGHSRCRWFEATPQNE
jgi:hypothetical protein